MKAIKISLTLIGICTIVLFSSFQEDEVEQPKDRVRAEVDKRLNQFRKVETKRCLQRMFDRAGALADSILMAESRAYGTDTLTRPPIPDRPGRPEVLLPKDSTPLAPLLNREEQLKEEELKEEKIEE